MARQNPMPRWEKEIGARVRQFRKALKLSKVAFAQELGIDGSRLASYEDGRVPLRYEMAGNISRKYGVSLRWLAEGKTPMQYYVEMDPKVENLIPPRLLFSTAYTDFLKPNLDEHFEEIDAWMKEPGVREEIEAVNRIIPPVVGLLGEEDMMLICLKRIRTVVGRLPPHLFDPFYRSLGQMLRAFEDRHWPEIEKHLKYKTLAAPQAKAKANPQKVRAQR